MNIGHTIRDLRKKRGISQGSLAEKIEISPAALSQIEGGVTYPKQSTLDKICNQLNIPRELLYLLSIDEDNIPESNKDKYRATFPTIHKLMVDIFSEDDNKEIVE